jgi:hypothetical protein
MRYHTRWTTAVLAAALSVLVLGPAASADPGASEFSLDRAGAAYADVGLVLLTGPPIEEGCVGEGWSLVDTHTVTTPSGLWKEFQMPDERLWLYEAESLGALLSANCGAIARGEAPPIPLLASGTGSTTKLEHWDGDTVRLIYQTRGTVTDAEGHEWSIQARWHTDVTFREDGPPIIRHDDEVIRLR